MPMWKSTQDVMNRACPISASVVGSSISFTSHVWAPVHNGQPLLFCKGASLLTGGPAGVLMVHLVDDPAGTWYPIDLRPGAGPFGCQFDLVGDATIGSSVLIDGSLYIYPGLYSQQPNA